MATARYSGALVRAVLLRAAAFAVLWWVLTEGAGGVGFALALIPLCVAATFALAPATGRRVSVPGLLRFLPFFFRLSLRGGIDVARRALDPRMRIQPALRQYRLRAADEWERVLVAGVLSLTPGSVSASLDGSRLSLHVLDSRLPVDRIVRDVEAHVAALFRDAPASAARRAGRRRRGGR